MNNPYPVFSFSPDFQEPPTWGTVDGRDLIDNPSGKSFAAWVGDTDFTSTFAYQTISPEEWRAFRFHFDEVAGRSKGFYLPTWLNDFELAADIDVGDVSILIKGSWFSDNLTENRPDTLGRRVFLVNHLGQFADCSIISATAQGENEILELYKPILIEAKKSKSVFGFLLLSRLASDTIELEIAGLGIARTSLTFRSTRHTRRVNQEESVNGEQVENLQPVTSVIATDEDPALNTTRATESLGPSSFGSPQGTNYESLWTARLDAESVILTSPAGNEIASELFDGVEGLDHLSFCFDGSAREVLTWDEANGNSRVAFVDLGNPERLSFEGRFPVAFNTYAIDSTVTAGEASIAVFYTKSDDASIYCRLRSESFLIEHVFCKSPVAPLFLQKAERVKSVIELVGVDAGHRRSRWISSNYITPFPSTRAGASVAALTGAYSETRLFAETSSAGAAAQIETLSGSYSEVAFEIEIEAQDAQGVSSVGRVQGVYENTRIFVDASTASSEGADEAVSSVRPKLTGQYEKKAILSEPETASGQAEVKPITGNYLPE